MAQEPFSKIPERDFKPKEIVSAARFVTLPAGTPREALLNPVSWVHVSRFLNPMDEITAVTADGSWYARYLVLFADRLQTKVVELEFHELAALDEHVVDTGDYEVKYVPNQTVRWTVIRKTDGKRVQSGLNSKDEALAWIGKNASRLAA